MSFFDDLLNKDTAQKHITQGSDAWDEIRCGRFTASEIYKIMEPSKREMTKEELYARPSSGKGSSAKLVYDYSKLSDGGLTYVKQKVAETLTGKQKPQSYAYPLVYGKETEAEAVEHFEKLTGLKTEVIGFCPYTDHAGGSPDRDIPEDDSILEIKCPWQSENQIDYLMLTDHYDLKRMYPAYYWQIQSNMLFANRTKGHFAAYDPRFMDDHLKMQMILVPANAQDHDLIRNQIALAVKEKLSMINLFHKPILS